RHDETRVPFRFPPSVDHDCRGHAAKRSRRAVGPGRGRLDPTRRDQAAAAWRTGAGYHFGGSDLSTRNRFAAAPERQRPRGLCRLGHDGLEGRRRPRADVSRGRRMVGTGGCDSSRIAQRELRPDCHVTRDLYRSCRRDGGRFDEADRSKRMTDTHVAARVPLPVGASTPAMTTRLERLFTTAVGVIVLPLYAPQPLVDLIGPSLGFSLRTASLLAMTPMLGYAAGLVLLVPLIDIVENRRAILVTLLADVVALAGVAAAPAPGMFLLAAFAAGCATSAIQ